MSETKELLSLKKLNMLRLANLKMNNTQELKLAEKLDRFLTKELNKKGINRVPSDKLTTINVFDLNQKGCVLNSFGHHASFTPETKRKLELEPKTIASETPETSETPEIKGLEISEIEGPEGASPEVEFFSVNF